MISDWYFCCCTKLTPKASNVFLSILDALDETSSPDLLIPALGELLRENIWVQVYALPFVLRTLRREETPSALRSVVTQFFEAIKENLGDELLPPFSILMDVMLNETNSEDALQALIQCTNAVSQLPFREVVTTPYLELRDFIGETVALAFLQYGVTADENLILANMLQSDNPEHLSIQLLIRKALNYQYGRLAFKIAVEIADEVPIGYSPDALLRRIWEELPLVPKYEPDLLALSADLMYSQYNSSSVIPAIMQESMALTQLRLWLRSTQKSKFQMEIYQEQANSILHTMGIEIPTPELELALPVILWQLTLWKKAAILDAAITAHELAKIWVTPFPAPPKKIHISMGGFVKKSSQLSADQERNLRVWKNQLEALAVIRGKPLNRTDYQALPDRFFIPFSANWLFFSPWLNTERSSSGIRYHGVDKAVLLIRLIGACDIAVRLLRQLEKKASGEYELAALIIHTRHVLKIYNP